MDITVMLKMLFSTPWISPILLIFFVPHAAPQMCHPWLVAWCTLPRTVRGGRRRWLDWTLCWDITPMGCMTFSTAVFTVSIWQGFSYALWSNLKSYVLTRWRVQKGQKMRSISSLPCCTHSARNLHGNAGSTPEINIYALTKISLQRNLYRPHNKQHFALMKNTHRAHECTCSIITGFPTSCAALITEIISSIVLHLISSRVQISH